MSHDVKPRKIVIIGGGSSGIGAAYRLLELSKEMGVELEVKLVEGSDRFGGVINTVKQDGFLIETGPDNFITTKRGVVSLAERLGITDQLLPTNSEYGRALIVRKRKMMELPEGFLLMAPAKVWPMVKTTLFSPWGKLRMGMEYFIPRKKDDGDESLANFVRRRFGSETLDRVVQPLIGGIYTANPEYLSLKATMPQFIMMEKKYRSLIKGMRASTGRRTAKNSGARYSMFMTFKDGLITLVDETIKRIGEAWGDDALQLNRPVDKLTQGEDQSWTVHYENGESETADGVILCCPSHCSSKMLREADKELAEKLRLPDYAASAVAYMAYKRDQIKHPLDAFGFVVPAIEKMHILAGSFSSVKYAHRAPDGCVLFRAFMGGAMQPEMMELDDQGLVDAAIGDLTHLLGISGEPMFTRLWRHYGAMPQYGVGHLDRVEAIRSHVDGCQGLQLAGNGFEGVGIPDCIEAGEKAAEKLMGYEKPAD